MNALFEGLKSLGPARLVAMVAVAIGMFGLLAFLALHGGSERMALLYADVDAREAGQIVEMLERQKVPVQLGAQGTQIMVPADQVARLRVLLAREGLPSGGSIGYELFDKADGLTTSQFQQKIAESRALEGELSRSIRAISGVRAAGVHLVMPKREPFARERQEAQASVMVTAVGAGRLDREAIQAIVNLVAGAVPGLRAKNIAVIDSKGNVLARAGEPAGPVAAAMGAAEMRRAVELRLSRAVEEMLERSLGPGRVRAEAAVDMDFDRIQETQERFDPENQVARSEQSNSNNSKTNEAAAGVSVQNNLPNAEAASGGAGTQEARQEATTNYEIGKTVRTLVREQPSIRRLSVAVMVDGAEERDAAGAMKWRARTPDELDRIARIVRGAVGYDEKRGDIVDVVSMRFAADLDPAAAEKPGLLGFALDKADILKLAQNAVVAIAALLALLFFVRPMVNRLTTLAPAALAGTSEATAALAAAGVVLNPATGQPMPALAGPAGLPQLAGPEGEDASMVHLANVDGQLRASSIRRLSGLVEAHPDESLTIVRAWMQEASK